MLQWCCSQISVRNTLAHVYHRARESKPKYSESATMIEKSLKSEAPARLVLMEARMNMQTKNPDAGKAPRAEFALLTPKEAAHLLKVSLSWLAKARMRGDGPPYIQFGRAVRYTEQALLHWMKSRQRFSTSHA